MDPFADIGYFEARHGDVPEAAKETVEALLDDASDLIRMELNGSGKSWLSNPENAPGAVKAITVAAAYRAWRDPDGISSEKLGASETAYRADVPDSLYLTKNELRTLRRVAGKGTFQATTLVSPYSGDDIRQGNDLIDEFPPPQGS